VNRAVHERQLYVSSEEPGTRAVLGGRNSKVKTLPKKQSVLWRKSILDSDGVKSKISEQRKIYVVLVENSITCHPVI